MYKPEVFVFMETRCDPLKLHKPLKKLGFKQFFSIVNEGVAGGIIVAGKYDQLKITWCAQEEQWIKLYMRSADGTDWRFTSVYASPSEQRRKVLWEALRATGMIPFHHTCLCCVLTRFHISLRR